MDTSDIDISFVRSDYLVFCRSEEVICGRIVGIEVSLKQATVNTLAPMVNGKLPFDTFQDMNDRGLPISLYFLLPFFRIREYLFFVCST